MISWSAAGKGLGVLLLLLLGAPPVAGHGVDSNGFPHVNPRTVDLGPDGSEHIDLVFSEGGGPFAGGWVFILNVVYDAGPGPVVFKLAHETEGAVGSWTFEPTVDTQVETGAMPYDGFYSLEIENPNDAPAKLVFMYDQSCNCLTKPIPVETPHALVVFNADVTEGSTWVARFLEPPVHNLTVSLAWRTDDQSRWPQDFEVLNVSTADDRLQDPLGLFHRIQWTAEHAGTYHFFAQAVSSDPRFFDPRAPMSVTILPKFELLDAGQEVSSESPGPGPLAVIAAAAAIVLFGRRR